MAKRKKKRTAVGQPITPAVLSELNALGSWPGHDGNFKPGGTWTHSYRIWTCHGYVSSGNDTVGALRLERKGAGTGGCTLRTRQRMVHSGGIKHSIHAEIRCRGDAIGSMAGSTGSSTAGASARRARNSGPAPSAAPAPPQPGRTALRDPTASRRR